MATFGLEAGMALFDSIFPADSKEAALARAEKYLAEDSLPLAIISEMWVLEKSRIESNFMIYNEEGDCLTPYQQDAFKAYLQDAIEDGALEATQEPIATDDRATRSKGVVEDCDMGEAAEPTPCEADENTMRFWVHKDHLRELLAIEERWPLSEDCLLAYWWPNERRGLSKSARGAAHINEPYMRARDWARSQAALYYAQGDTRPPGAIARELHAVLKANDQYKNYNLRRVPTINTITGWIKDVAPEQIQGRRGRPRKDE